MYKYFCGECGHKFETDMPEPEGHKEEFKVFCEYDNALLKYEN